MARGFQKGNKLWDNERSRKTRLVKGGVPWNKGRRETRPEVIARQSESHIGKKQSAELVTKRGNHKTGEGAHHWLGEDVGYAGLHNRLYKKYGHPIECEFCGKEGAPYPSGKWNIEYANKSGRYLTDESDWLRLCLSCHRRYDHFIRTNT